MTLEEAETRVGMTLPSGHRRAMLDLSDPIHSTCDFLVLNSPHTLLRWVDVNESLRGRESNGWPAFLVAFASNGCGDYFAYDLRAEPLRVIYIDPDFTVEENLWPTIDLSTTRLPSGTPLAWFGARLERNIAKSIEPLLSPRGR